MAMKAALVAALLVALVGVGSATTYTTTVTTTSYDEGYQQCSQQIQGREFQSCQSYLKQRSTNPQQQDESLEKCCEQLKEMDRYRCGCEAIRHAVQQAQQSGPSYQTGQSEKIYERARALPRACNLQEKQCRFSVVFL